MSGMGNENIPSSENIELGTTPTEESKLFLLRIGFISAPAVRKHRHFHREHYSIPNAFPTQARDPISDFGCPSDRGLAVGKRTASP